MSLPRFSVENQVLVNMVMLVVLVAGVAFAFTIVREMFPESRADSILIVAAYPATQPEELEKAVTIKIEEAVRDVEGIEKVNSTISEGLSSTTLTLYNEVADVDAVLQEVKNEVDAIADLPDDLERITVAKAEPTLPVIMVALHGEGDEADLKRAARNLRDEILLLPGVSDVSMSGIRDDEISVELRPAKLQEYDITFNEVAQAIGATNIDISGGNLKGDRSQVSVRTLGEELSGQELEDIEIKTLPGGAVIRLSDVATIIDRFVDSDQRSFFQGEPSVNLIVQKTSDQDAIQISGLVQAFVRGKQGADFDPWGMQEALAKPLVLASTRNHQCESERVHQQTGRTTRPGKDLRAKSPQSIRPQFQGRHAHRPRAIRSRASRLDAAKRQSGSAARGDLPEPVLELARCVLDRDRPTGFVSRNVCRDVHARLDDQSAQHVRTDRRSRHYRG